MTFFFNRAVLSGFFLLTFAWSSCIYAQTPVTKIRAWTFNVAGHHQELQKNYGEFLTQVNQEHLPDFIGCQEALNSTNKPLLHALNHKAGKDRYALIKGAERGGPENTSPDELCSIIYDQTKWEKLSPPPELVETILANTIFQLFDIWMLNQASSGKQQILLNKLANQKDNTFQLTWRANHSQTNIGGPFEDRLNEFGPFSRIATWAIFQLKTPETSGKILVVNTQLCRKMNKIIPEHLRKIIYQELVDNLIEAYLAFYSTDPNHLNAILIGDMNDPDCFKKNGGGNIQEDPHIKIDWQEGAGHRPTKNPPNSIDPAGNKDWILFFSERFHLNFLSSKFYCTNIGKVSDHPYVKEATLSFTN